MTSFTVLVADPHRELAEMAAEVLRDRGFTALVALNVRQMVALLRETPGIEVAVCHATLPADQGDDMRHALREVISDREDVGLVVISARPFEDVLDIPPDAVRLSKPFGAAELLKAVNAARSTRVPR